MARAFGAAGERIDRADATIEARVRGALCAQVDLAAAAGEVRRAHALVLGRRAKYAYDGARAAVLAHHLVRLRARIRELAQKARKCRHALAHGRRQRRRHAQAVVQARIRIADANLIKTKQQQQKHEKSIAYKIEY